MSEAGNLQVQGLLLHRPLGARKGRKGCHQAAKLLLHWFSPQRKPRALSPGCVLLIRGC